MNLTSVLDRMGPAQEPDLQFFIKKLITGPGWVSQLEVQNWNWVKRLSKTRFLVQLQGLTLQGFAFHLSPFSMSPVSISYSLSLGFLFLYVFLSPSSFSLLSHDFVQQFIAHALNFAIYFHQSSPLHNIDPHCLALYNSSPSSVGVQLVLNILHFA